MYRTINVELARLGWKIKDLAERAGIKYTTLLTKLSGGSEFTLSESFAIQKALMTDIPLAVLFARSDEEGR